MTAKLLEILIMEGVAALMLWLAYMIGVKKRMTLIAGYNSRTAWRVTDPDGLAKLIARLCAIVAIASALMPIATGLWGDSATGAAYCIGAYAGTILGSVALTTLQARDYMVQRTG